jgi:prepilin-type N-terminal cleavage/methylation domain-containing protein/prepilin-type processing-associated H-X9-DG protein
MRKTNGAFTLIELLVVIAIIAILAAILFPVFAQAKSSAKKAVEISNAKQQALATLMYVNDSDGVFPKAATINWGGWGDGECNATVGCKSWDKLIHPYMKNWEILDSPLDKSQGVPFPNGTIKRSWRAAQNVFSGLGGMPWVAAGTVSKPSINESAAGAPAGTIMLVPQRNEGLYGGTWWVWSTWYENWVWWTTSSNTRPNNPTLLTPFVGDSTPAELGGPNNYWGGVDISVANNSTFAFLDGHVKTHSRGHIFPGYLQKPNRSSAVNTAFPGVCLEVDQWSGDTTTDCPLPQ